MTDFDVIVVGGGIIGTCTAYHCQRLGLRTLLIEQFKFGHSNGSSHGQSRIIRYAHTEAEYIPLVNDAYKQIAHLEKKRSEQLWKKTGLMFFGTTRGSRKISEHLKQYNLSHELLNNVEVSRKFPQFSYDATWSAVFDPMGGVLYADKWLSAFRDEFVKLGGIALDQRTFLSKSPNGGNGLHVNTSNGSFTTKKLIFTAGTWLQELLPEITKVANVQPEAMAVTYWRPRNPSDMHFFTQEEFPVFMALNEDTGEDAYGLPAVDYPDAIKFCNHRGDPFTIGDQIQAPKQHNIDLPATHLKDHIKLIDHDKPAHLDRCKYTMSSDHHYVIDFHPKDKDVLIAGCMSGTGFKVAPGIGNTLAHMAAGKQLPYDVSFFKLSRFNSKM